MSVAIISYARTPIGKAGRGAFADVHPISLCGHVIRHAVERAGLKPNEIDEVVNGSAVSVGPALGNIARQAALRAGLPETTTGQNVTRACASGLQAISAAAHRINAGEISIAVAAGTESISLQLDTAFPNIEREAWLEMRRQDVYMPMIDTAEVVARRYGVSRHDQDLYSLESQRRTAAAQEAGYFDAEIVPLDANGPGISERAARLAKDEGNRAGTTLEGLASLSPVRGDGHCVTAGNASQLSDGSAAVVLMSEQEAERRRLKPLGFFRGLATAGCAPDEMGIGPVLAVPRLLERFGLNAGDIGLWELNEAFAAQVVFCMRELNLPHERLNVDGGAISIGHPYGMSGVRMIGHLLIAAQRHGARQAVATMCVGGGMGAAGLLEIA